MWPSLIEELGVFLDDLIQMAFSQNQHVIQTLASNASLEPFADRVGFGCAIGRFQDFNLTPFRDGRKVLPTFTIAISNQEAWPPTEGGCFPKLLGNPFISWVSGDIEVDDLAGTQLHDKEKIDLTEK
jgi:hypothetical protein